MSIDAANKVCLEKIQASTAVWSDIKKAKDVVPGMGERTVLHAGPPLTWEADVWPNAWSNNGGLHI